MEPLDATSDASLSGLVASLSERYDPSNADHMAALRQLWELAWPGTPWQAAAGESSEVSPCGQPVEYDGSLAATSRQPRSGAMVASRQPRGSSLRQPRGGCGSLPLGDRRSLVGGQTPLWA